MCEYAKFVGEIPICTVDNNNLCTLCVLGNADTYKKAREEAEQALTCRKSRQDEKEGGEE